MEADVDVSDEDLLQLACGVSPLFLGLFKLLDVEILFASVWSLSFSGKRATFATS